MPYNQYPLAGQAQGLANLGRYGDSMLVHMRPDEVAGLASIARAQGGSLSVNPRTGLVEAWGIKSITKPFRKVADDVLGIDDSGGIAGSLGKVAKQLGPVGTLAAAYFGGPWGAALMAGLQGGDEKKAFNFKRAATAAAMTYAGQELFKGLEAAGGAEGAAGSGSSIGEGLSAEGVGYGDIPASGAGSSSFAVQSGVTPSQPGFFENIGNQMSNFGSNVSQNVSEFAADPTKYISDAASNAYNQTVEGVSNLGDRISTAGEGLQKVVSGDKAAQAALKSNFGMTDAAIGVGGFQAEAALDEAEKQMREAERILADQANRTAEEKAWAQNIMSTYAPRYRATTAEDVSSWLGAAGGGIIALAGGRYLKGPGDGTSDSIPARIEGGQEARLADGEYVIDARTVSELGNGSSDAGARKLREMVNRVHAARRRAQRGKPSSADKYLPV